MRTFAVLIAAMSLCASAYGAIWTYPSPGAEFRSAKYAVTVRQGKVVEPSFTYVDHNSAVDLRRHMTDYNHWSTFSFSGQVEVEVELLDPTIRARGCEVRPLSAKIRTKTSGQKLKFTIDRPGKFWIKTPGQDEHPLFIFADPPEENIPARDDPKVLWFEGGQVHNVGEQYRLTSGQTVYLAGGAYVKGTFTGEGLSDVRICGRGILSGIEIPRKPNREGIPWNLVQFDGLGEQQVEGITCVQPPHFVLLSRGKFTVRNTKLFGWYHQTDGWGGGAGSVVEDTFMKVNDDSVKFYAPDQAARRLVIWQQVNGAPFQLGWGGESQGATNCVAEDIVILKCESNRAPKKPSNTALVNLQSQHPQSRIDGVRLQHVRVEDDLLYLVGLKEVAGRIRNLRLQDVEVLGQQRGPNYLQTVGQGQIREVVFANVRIGGQPLAAAKTRLVGDAAPIAVEPNSSVGQTEDSP